MAVRRTISVLIAGALLTLGLPGTADAFSPAVAMRCGSFDEQPGSVTIDEQANPALTARLQFISCSGEDILPAPDAPIVGVADFALNLATLPTVLNRPFDSGWDGSRPPGYQPVVTRLSMKVKDFRNGYFAPPVIHRVSAWVTAEIEDIGQPSPPQPHTLVLTVDGITDGRYLPGRHLTGRFTFDESALTSGSGAIFVTGSGVNEIVVRNELPATVNDNGPVNCSDGTPGPASWRYRYTPTAIQQDQRVTVLARPDAVCTDTLGLGIQSLRSMRFSLKAHEDNDPTTDDPGETPLTGTMNLTFDDGNPATPTLRAIGYVSAESLGAEGNLVAYKLIGLIRKGPLAGVSMETDVLVNLGDCSPSTHKCTVIGVGTPHLGYPFAIEDAPAA